MSAYLGWEELDDESNARQVTPESANTPASHTHQGVGGERLAALMAEREKLEQQLMRLIGKAPPSAEDKRRDALFPMPIHSAESRLADRKAAQEEQRARARARRTMEHTRLRHQDEQRREDEKRQTERRRIQFDAHQRVEARKREENFDAWLRSLRIQENVRSQWAAQRELALHRQQLTRARARVEFELRNESRRERALERRVEQEREAAALQERLDRRARKRCVDDWPND